MPKSKKKPTKKIPIWGKIVKDKKLGNRVIWVKLPIRNDSREHYQFNFLLHLAKLWAQYPEQRFGQLLFNYTRIGTRAGVGLVQDPFYYADEEIFEDFKKSITK